MFENLQRGDLIELTWRDICEDPVGNPDEATLVKRHSIGYFWAKKLDEGLPVVVTTTTIDEELGSGSQGYCVYPESCIVKVKAIKRKRKVSKKKEEKIDKADDSGRVS